MNVKLLFIISIISLFIFLTAHMGSAAVTVLSGESRLPENTLVGSVDVSNMKDQEAVELLSTKASSWKENHTISLNVDGKSLRINNDFVEFDVGQTIENAKDRSSSGIVVQTDRSYMNDIKGEMSEGLAAAFQEEKFMEALKDDLSQLPDESLDYNVYEFVSREANELVEVVGKYETELPAGVDIDRSMSIFTGSVVSSQSKYQLLPKLSEDGVYSEMALDSVATAIYGASLKAGFIIQERHISQQLPSYTELGFESTIDLKHNQDLTIYNPYKDDYTLTLTQEGRTLRAEWSGFPTLTNFYVDLSDVQTIEPSTVIRYSSFINPGTYKTIQEGEEGQVVRVYRIDRSSDASNKEFISEDYYPPEPIVEEHPVPENASDASSGANGQGGSSEEDSESSEDEDKSSDSKENSGEGGETSKGESDNSDADNDGDLWEKDPEDRNK